MAADAEIAVVVVAWNTREEAAALLRSIPASGLPLSRVVVADNASADGTAAMVRAEFPAAQVLALAQNTGYAFAANRGIEATTADFVLLLNGDTKLTPGAPAALARALALHPAFGAAAPRLVDASGATRPSVRRFPSARALLHQFTAWRYLRLFRPAFETYKMRNGPPPAPGAGLVSVEAPLGAAVMLRRRALADIGGFCEEFFLYFEDVDLFRRLWDRGWRTLFVPEAVVEHLGGASSRQAKAALYAPTAASALLYAARAFPAWKWALFRPAFVVALFLRAAVEVVGERLAEVKYRLRGDLRRARRKAERVAARLALLRAGPRALAGKRNIHRGR
ncbi:MAG: glycosyltransferase family 2 protein [Planctomycetes bacterium]|nr:glycosyltransferase family 2 protein [Planctomycetota bacterium]